MTSLNFKTIVSTAKVNVLGILFFFFSYTTYAQQTITGNIIHDGLQREYILYVPTNYTGSSDVPLVFNFHGYGSNAFEQLNYGDFRPLAERNGFLVVHPLGTIDAVGNTHFNVGWGTSTVDDVGFTAALIDYLSANYAIDQNRIYSTGMSNGGFMSYKLACELSDKIAAIASVTGTMTRGQRNNCITSHPVPIMEIHGTNDAIVPYYGNQLFESTIEVMRFWVDATDSDRKPKVMKLEDINTNDSSKVEYYVFSDEDNEVTVEHFKVINGGHTWPGSKFEIGPVTNRDIDASAEIWKFFSKYDINGLVDDDNDDEADGNYDNDDNIDDDLGYKIYPNPTNSYLRISNNSKIKDYRLVSPSGIVVSSGLLSLTNDVIDISNVPEGIYFLVMGNMTHRILKTN